MPPQSLESRLAGILRAVTESFPPELGRRHGFGLMSYNGEDRLTLHVWTGSQVVTLYLSDGDLSRATDDLLAEARRIIARATGGSSYPSEAP